MYRLGWNGDDLESDDCLCCLGYLTSWFQLVGWMVCDGREDLAWLGMLVWTGGLIYTIPGCWCGFVKIYSLMILFRDKRGRSLYLIVAGGFEALSIES